MTFFAFLPLQLDETSKCKMYNNIVMRLLSGGGNMLSEVKSFFLANYCTYFCSMNTSGGYRKQGTYLRSTQHQALALLMSCLH